MLNRIVKSVFRRLGFQISLIPKSEEVKSIETIKKGTEIVKKISPELKVLNGIFMGLRYPNLSITEAALAPKIVGSYESQLHEVIKVIINKPYENIIDVGSAEGYYAVGLGMQMPNTLIHAFDINKKDLLFSKKMAELNHVSNITYNDFCNSDTLINFDFGKKGLIFCDCEGYELELFTEKVVHALSQKNVDVLVEMHDVCSPEISSTIISRFASTHDFRIVNTNMALKIGWNGLESLNEEEKKFAVLEHRGGIDKSIYMEWAYFTVKQP